jgi:hypothetical protein
MGKWWAPAGSAHMHVEGSFGSAPGQFCIRHVTHGDFAATPSQKFWTSPLTPLVRGRGATASAAS